MYFKNSMLKFIKGFVQYKIFHSFSTHFQVWILSFTADTSQNSEVDEHGGSNIKEVPTIITIYWFVTTCNHLTFMKLFQGELVNLKKSTDVTINKVPRY